MQEPQEMQVQSLGWEDALEDSCLENPMDRGAWWATVHRVTKSQTRLKRLRMHTPGKSYGKKERV